MDRFQAALADRIENRTDVEFDDVIGGGNDDSGDNDSGGGSPTSPRINDTAAAQMIKTLREQHEQELEQLLSAQRRHSTAANLESNTCFDSLAGKIQKQKQSQEDAAAVGTGHREFTNLSAQQQRLHTLNNTLRRAQDLILSTSGDPAFRRIAEKASRHQRDQHAFCVVVSASAFSRSVLSLQMERRGWSCVAVSRTMELEERLVEARRKFKQGLGAMQFAGRSRLGDAFEQSGGNAQQQQQQSLDTPIPKARLVILDSFTHELPEESAKLARIIIQSVQDPKAAKEEKAKNNNPNEAERDKEEKTQQHHSDDGDEVAVIQLTQIRSDGGRGLQLPNFVEADRTALDELLRGGASGNKSGNKNGEKNLTKKVPPIDMVVKSAFTATLAEKLSAFFLTESARSRSRIVSVSSVYDSIRGILGAVSTRRLDGGDKVIGEMYDCFAPSSEIIKKMFEIEKEDAQQQKQQSSKGNKSFGGKSGLGSHEGSGFDGLRGSMLLRGAAPAAASAAQQNNTISTTTSPAGALSLSFAGTDHEEIEVEKPNPLSQSIRRGGGGGKHVQQQQQDQELTSTALGTVDPSAFLSFETDPRFVVLRAHYHHLRSLMGRFQEEIRGKDRRIRTMQDEIGTLTDEVKNLNASSSGIGVTALLAIPKSTVDTAVGTADDEDIVGAGGGSWTAERIKLIDKLQRSERRVKQLQDRVSSQANDLAAAGGPADKVLSAKNIELQEQVLELTTERDLLKEVADAAQKQLFEMSSSASSRLHSSIRGNPLSSGGGGANNKGSSSDGRMSFSDSARGALVINGNSFSNAAALVSKVSQQAKELNKVQARQARFLERLRLSEESSMAALDMDANLLNEKLSGAAAAAAVARREQRVSGKLTMQRRFGGGGVRRSDSALTTRSTATTIYKRRRGPFGGGSEGDDEDEEEEEEEENADGEDARSSIGDGAETIKSSYSVVSRKSTRRGGGGSRYRGGRQLLPPSALRSRRNGRGGAGQQRRRTQHDEHDDAGTDADEQQENEAEMADNNNLVPAGTDPALLEDGSYRYPADQDEKLMQESSKRKAYIDRKKLKDNYGRTNSMVLLNNVAKEKRLDALQRKRKKQSTAAHSSSSFSTAAAAAGAARDANSDADSLDSNDRRHKKVETTMHDAAKKLHLMADSLDGMFRRVVEYTEKAAAARREGLTELFEAVAQVSERCTRVNDASRIDGIRLEIDEVQKELDGLLSRPLGPEQGSMAALRAKGDAFFRLYVRRHHLVADLRRLEENCNVHTHSRVKETLLRRLLAAQARLDEVGNYLLNNNELFMYAESRMEVHKLFQELAPWITRDEFELLQREGRSAVTEMITKCQLARHTIENNEAERSLDQSQRLSKQQSIANPAVGSSGAGRRRLSVSIAAFERTAKMLQGADEEDESMTRSQSGSFRFRVGQQRRQALAQQLQQQQQGGAPVAAAVLLTNADGTPFEPVAAAAQDLDKDISRFVLDESVEGLRGILKHLLEMWTTDMTSTSSGAGAATAAGKKVSSPQSSSFGGSQTVGASSSSSVAAAAAARRRQSVSPRRQSLSPAKRRQSSSSPSSSSPVESPSLLSLHSPKRQNGGGGGGPASSPAAENISHPNEDEEASLDYIINHWKSDAMRLVLDCAYDVNAAINEFIEKEKASQEFIETAGFDIRPHNRKILERLLHDPFADPETGARPVVDPSATNIRIVSVVESFREAALVMHGQLKRLLLELKRRTPLTKVKIVDYAVEKTLYRKKRLRQVSEFPALMTVDAALIGRFADYFEDETKGQYLLARAAFKKRAGQMMKTVNTQTTAMGALVDRAHVNLTVEQQQQLLAMSASGGRKSQRTASMAVTAASSLSQQPSPAAAGVSPFQAAVNAMNAAAPAPPDLMLNVKGKRNLDGTAADRTPLANGSLVSPSAPGLVAQYGADGNTIQISFGSGADTSAVTSPSKHQQQQQQQESAAGSARKDSLFSNETESSKEQQQQHDDNDDDAEYEIEYDEKGNVVSKTKIKEKVSLPPLLLLRQQQMKEEKRLREIEMAEQKKNAPKTDEAVSILNAAAASASAADALKLPDIFGKSTSSPFSSSYQPKETDIERKEKRRVKATEGKKSNDQTLISFGGGGGGAGVEKEQPQPSEQQEDGSRQQAPEVSLRQTATTKSLTTAAERGGKGTTQSFLDENEMKLRAKLQALQPTGRHQQQQHKQQPQIVEQEKQPPRNVAPLSSSRAGTTAVAGGLAVTISPPPPSSSSAQIVQQDVNNGVLQQRPDPQHLPWSGRSVGAHATAGRTTISSGRLATTTLGDPSVPSTANTGAAAGWAPPSSAVGSGRVPPALPSMRPQQQLITSRQMALATTGSSGAVTAPRSSEHSQQQYRLVVVRDTDAAPILPGAVPSPPPPRKPRESNKN